MRILAVLPPVQLLVNVAGKAVKMGQVFGSLAPSWETQMEFKLLASDWCIPGYLGTEPVDGHSLPLSI